LHLNIKNIQRSSKKQKNLARKFVQGYCCKETSEKSTIIPSCGATSPEGIPLGESRFSTQNQERDSSTSLRSVSE